MVTSRQVVGASIFLLALLSLTFLLVILFLRLRFERQRRYEEKKIGQWEPLLLAYLEGEVSEKEIIRSVGGQRKDLEIFATLVSDYLVNLRGLEHEKLTAMVRSAGLVDFEKRALSAKAPWRRAVAAERLKVMGATWATPSLRAGLRDRSPLVQVACADALSRLGDTESLESAVETLLTHEQWNRLKTADILTAFAKLDPGRLVKYIFDESLGARQRALVVEVLGHMGYREAAPILLELAEASPEPEILIAVIKFMGATEVLESVDFLLRMLSHTNWVVRSQSAKSLGRVGDPRAVKRLSALTRDPVWWVRHESASALGNIVPEGLEALERISQRDPDRYARAMAEQVLYEVGERRGRAA